MKEQLEMRVRVRAAVHNVFFNTQEYNNSEADYT